MPEPTEFQRGIDAAVHDVVELGREVVLEAAKESERSIKGLNSKFCSGYRRFAYHELSQTKVKP